ncbi:hypothetical protein QR680_008961 [Steinernema hermaphroditum]|uniref:Uncharacterized protein n=1 Tax=Steinernema hermaphroditum TaxID=289476 RepID=A0AA39M809_9BILA|nr:hypothetical protein QR680_008961 [Steinernema hermaphroditum]
MRLFFIVKWAEVAVALLLVLLVLRTTKLCGLRGQEDITPNQCPKLFDPIERYNDPRAVERFFDRLYHTNTTKVEDDRLLKKRATREAFEKILNATEIGQTSNGVDRNEVTFDGSGGIIEYVVLKIQHGSGQWLTCCDITVTNMMCISNSFSSAAACSSLSPVAISIVTWLVIVFYNLAHMLKIFRSPMPPKVEADIRRTFADLFFWFLSASVLSYLHFTWTKSWTLLPYFPYFPARWIVAEVVAWLMIGGIFLQFRFHKKLFFTVRLTAPPRTYHQLRSLRIPSLEMHLEELPSMQQQFPSEQEVFVDSSERLFSKSSADSRRQTATL